MFLFRWNVGFSKHAQLAHKVGKTRDVLKVNPDFGLNGQVGGNRISARPVVFKIDRHSKFSFRWSHASHSLFSAHVKFQITLKWRPNNVGQK